MGCNFAASGGPEVLRGTNLSVSAGETVAITGVSGCGKSTLLHILGGLAWPDTGEVSVGGTVLGGLSQTALGQLRNRQLGFVYQSHHLLGEFTAAENVAMPLLVAGVAWDTALAQAQDLLAAVGLPGKAPQYPGKLSGGERQRVALGRALVNKPACIIADEPTGNLDRHSAATVVRLLLAACAERSCALVVATHDMGFAACLDRQLELREGNLVPVSC